MGFALRGYTSTKVDITEAERKKTEYLFSTTSGEIFDFAIFNYQF